MLQHIKRRLRILALTILMLAILIVAVLAYTAVNIREWAVSKAESSTGREVTIADDIKIDWRWPVSRFHLHDVRIANFAQGTEKEMFSVENALITVNFKRMLMGRLVLPEVTLENPVLLLEKDNKGNANWNFTDNAGGAVALEMAKPDDRTDIPGIGRLLIKNGRITYKDPIKDTNINVMAETISGKARRRDNLQLKGEGNYQGEIFAMDITGGSGLELRETDKPYPVDMNFTFGKTKVSLKGTMLDPVKFKGMDTKLTIKGDNAAKLFDIFGTALPPTPPYEVVGQLVYDKDIWYFRDFKGRLGNSDLRGIVEWDRRKMDDKDGRPILRASFVSEKLNFADLGGFIGAKQGATKDENPYIIPETPLDTSRVKSMDAEVTFTGKQLISDALPLDDFYLKVNLKESLLKIEPVRFGTANGDIEAFLTANARAEPVKIDGDFNFRRLSLKPIFAKLSDKLGQQNYAEGYIGGTAKLSGTGKSLRQMLANAHGDVGLGMEGGQLSNLIIELLGLDVAQSLGFLVKGDKPVAVRCIIGDFGVENGRMNVRHFVIDTTDSNIKGEGHINLKDETMDLKLQTKPKDNTILSLNSPVSVRGTLKHPDIDVNVLAVGARGALAAAAAVVAPPIAALAFIEPGLGKDSNCGALVIEMNKNTGKSRGESLIPKNKSP